MLVVWKYSLVLVVCTSIKYSVYSALRKTFLNQIKKESAMTQEVELMFRREVTLIVMDPSFSINDCWFKYDCVEIG